MRKRITLRSLMLAIVVLAIGLVPIRIYRQYQADRVEFNRLVDEHNLATIMKEAAVSSAWFMREMDELNRSTALRIRQSTEALARLQRSLDESPSRPAFIGPLGDLGQTSGERRWDDSLRSLEELVKSKEQPGPSRNRYEADVEECTRKEAAARAAIDHWKATHWWF